MVPTAGEFALLKPVLGSAPGFIRGPLRARPRQGGFTLIELLIASALMTVLLMGLWSLVGTFTNLRTKGEQRAGEIRRAVGALSQIATDLRRVAQPRLELETTANGSSAKTAATWTSGAGRGSPAEFKGDRQSLTLSYVIASPPLELLLEDLREPVDSVLADSGNGILPGDTFEPTEQSSDELLTISYRRRMEYFREPAPADRDSNTGSNSASMTDTLSDPLVAEQWRPIEWFRYESHEAYRSEDDSGEVAESSSTAFPDDREPFGFSNPAGSRARRSSARFPECRQP